MAPKKKDPNFESNYRNGNGNYSLVALLPAILTVRYLFYARTEWNSIDCLLMLTSMTPLVFYRLSINETLVLIANGIVHSCFLANWQLSFEHFAVFLLNSSLIVLLNWLPNTVKKCFTFNELSIVLQCHNFLLLSLIRGLKSDYLSCIDQSRESHFGAPFRVVDEASTAIVVRVCFIALYLALISLPVIGNDCLKTLWFAVCIPAVVYVSFLFHFDIEIVQWLYALINQSPQRILLFASWLVILSISCLFAFIFSRFSTSTANTCTRKIFHVALTIVYVCGLYVDRSFLDFSSRVLFVAFAYLEILRAANVLPFSKVLESICLSFRDEKDSGILTLSHIYLFVGCFSSLWLSSNIDKDSIFLLSAGVISVGIGDTFASVGGFFLGRHRWPGSKKTVEGSICSLLAQGLVYVLLYRLFAGQILTSSTLIVIGVLSLLSSFVETITVNHVDNLVLPLVQYLFTLLIAKYV